MAEAGQPVSAPAQSVNVADMKDAAQVIEDCVFTPMLGDLFRLTIEYADPQQVLLIPGTQDWPSRRFSVQELRGNWAFRWVGSLQAQDMQVKSQRMVAVLGMLGKIGPVVLQDLQTRGKRINWEALLKRIWRDGLGERGLDQIIVELTPEERQQMMMQQLMAAQQGAAPKRKGGSPGANPGYAADGASVDNQTSQMMAGPGAPQGG